jgi:hypothetical protein
MSSKEVGIGYRKGKFPKTGIHKLVIGQIRRLRPETPVHWVDKVGESIAKTQPTMGFPWAVIAILFFLSFLTMGLGFPVLIVAMYASLRWGHRGNPNRPDRLVIKISDLEALLSKDQKEDSVMVYADALHAVMGANLDESEYRELATMLKNLLQSEQEAKEKRASLEQIYNRLSSHDPIKAVGQARIDFDDSTNAATRQVIENHISVLEKQQERREHLRTHILQLEAQESLAVELIRSVGESALQLDTIPYVAITPILNNARDLVYEMDHEVLAFERAVVEMEVEPYRLNLALGSN